MAWTGPARCRGRRSGGRRRRCHRWLRRCRLAPVWVRPVWVRPAWVRAVRRPRSARPSWQRSFWRWPSLADFLADFFGAALDFLGGFLGLFRRLPGGFLRRFLRGFLGGFFLRRQSLFFLLLLFLPFLFFFPLAIVILLLPLIHVYRASNLSSAFRAGAIDQFNPGLEPPVAQSRSSTVCTTGTDVPLAICTMHPILPAAIMSGPTIAILATFRSRNRFAMSGWRML